MSRTFARFTIKVAAGAGMFGAALAFSPATTATPFKTGGYECVSDAAGAAADPIGAACAGAPVTDMAGIPMALPGPIPAAAAALGAFPAVVPPVPVVVPPVPVVVPPLPAGVAPVGGALPIGAPVVGAAGAPVIAPLPGAPILDMAGGKGASTETTPAGGPISGVPIIPGPAVG